MRLPEPLRLSAPGRLPEHHAEACESRCHKSSAPSNRPNPRPRETFPPHDLINSKAVAMAELHVKLLERCIALERCPSKGSRPYRIRYRHHSISNDLRLRESSLVSTMRQTGCAAVRPSAARVPTAQLGPRVSGGTCSRSLAVQEPDRVPSSKPAYSVIRSTSTSVRLSTAAMTML